jgi:hypothetical protein
VRTSRISTADSPVSQRLHGPHPAAWSGIAFAALFLIGYFMLQDVPGTNASTGEVQAFYSSDDRTSVVIAGLYVVPFAGIAFMWFVASIRHQTFLVTNTEDYLFGTVQMLSSILFIAMLFVSAAARAAPALAIDVDNATADPDSRELLFFAQAELMIFSLRAAGIFMMSSTIRLVRAQLAPRWFRLVSFAAALVLMLSASYVPWLILILPVWVGMISVFILFRARRVGTLEPA